MTDISGARYRTPFLTCGFPE